MRELTPGGSSERLPRHALQIAQIVEVHLPALIDHQLARQPRGVVVSIQQLIDEADEILFGSCRVQTFDRGH
jgi:hypothetical protein